MLVKLVHEKKEKWSDVLDGCVFAYNTSVQDSTKYTPFQLMFGRQATLAIDVETVKATPEESVQAYASLDNPDHTMVTEARLAVLQRAKENIGLWQPTLGVMPQLSGCMTAATLKTLRRTGFCHPSSRRQMI